MTSYLAAGQLAAENTNDAKDSEHDPVSCQRISWVKTTFAGYL